MTRVHILCATFISLISKSFFLSCVSVVSLSLRISCFSFSSLTFSCILSLLPCTPSSSPSPAYSFFSLIRLTRLVSKTTGKEAPCARTGDIKASGCCSAALSRVSESTTALEDSNQRTQSTQPEAAHIPLPLTCTHSPSFTFAPLE